MVFVVVVVEVGPSGEEAATWTTELGSLTSWVGWVRRCEEGVIDSGSSFDSAADNAGGLGWSERGRVEAS